MREEKGTFSLNRALVAELYGTFLLTFVDAASGILRASTQELSVLAQSLAPAAVVATMIFCIGEVSGAHINPAVTFSFTLRGVFPLKCLPAYWLAQFIGALLAGGLLLLLFGSQLDHGMTLPKGHPTFSLLTEIVLTWFLLTTILTSATASSIKGWRAAFPVGATLLFCNLVGKEISGASMNPARSLGPAIIAGDFSYLWLYVLGPLIGAAFGVGTTYLLRGRPSVSDLEAAQGK